ncbi:MAG: hypothetical protein ACLP0J_07370 [Solirubrobacteraceae bacterium]
MNRKRLAASTAMITTALIAGLIAALSSAGANTTTGSIHFYGVGSQAPTGQIVVTGAIDAAGVTRGSVADHGRVRLSTVYLPKGTLVLDNTKLKAAVAKGLDPGDPTSCSAVFTVTVPARIVRGTGAYAGASGNLTGTTWFAAVAPKANNGQCGAISLIDWTRGSGSISFK